MTTAALPAHASTVPLDLTDSARTTVESLMKARFLVVAVGLSTMGSEVAYSQVTARQGETPRPPVIVRFASPMILDLPLPSVLHLEPNAPIPLPEVGKYRCDNDVQLLNLWIRKRYTGPRKARSLELLVTGSVLVSESYDRRADIAIRLKSGEAVLGSQI